MKPTAKAMYALEALITLDMLSQSDYVNLQTIAELRHTSIKFLEQIFTICKKHQLIESKKGPSGGYRFTKDPNSITIYELFVIFENSFVVPNEENNNLYHNIQTEIDAVLSFYTIRDLAERYQSNIARMDFAI